MLHGILWSSCRISEFLQPIELGSNSLRVPIGVKDNTATSLSSSSSVVLQQSLVNTDCYRL